MHNYTLAFVVLAQPISSVAYGQNGHPNFCLNLTKPNNVNSVVVGFKDGNTMMYRQRAQNEEPTGDVGRLISTQIALVVVSRNNEAPKVYQGVALTRRLWKQSNEQWQFNEDSLGHYAEQLASNDNAKNALLTLAKEAVNGNAGGPQTVDEIWNELWGQNTPGISEDDATSGAEKLALIIQCLYGDSYVGDIAERPAGEAKGKLDTALRANASGNGDSANAVGTGDSGSDTPAPAHDR